MIEQEEEGCAFGFAANRVDAGWDFGRWSHTRFLAHALQERPGIAFFGPGAEVVGRAFAEGLARYGRRVRRSEEHTSELQSRQYLVCRLLLEKKTNSESRHVA